MKKIIIISDYLTRQQPVTTYGPFYLLVADVPSGVRHDRDARPCWRFLSSLLEASSAMVAADVVTVAKKSIRDFMIFICDSTIYYVGKYRV